MLTILDSPLNKAGFVKLYIHTDDNVLIEIGLKVCISPLDSLDFVMTFNLTDFIH